VSEELGNKWREAFREVLGRRPDAAELKVASVEGRLGDWTRLLTGAVVETCERVGLAASAIGHKLPLLPIAQSEYLSLDVVAFGDGERRWRFPAVVAELENSLQDDRIAYSLWKVLCVRADLRLVICYRRSGDAVSSLVRFLRQEVVEAMGLAGRVGLEGETILVVGNRDESEYFPYGFFKWWRLDKGTGGFDPM